MAVGQGGEGELVEMSDEVDDDTLNWMVVKDILGVRMEGADMYGERERGKGTGDVLPPPAAVSARAAGDNSAGGGGGGGTEDGGGGRGTNVGAGSTMGAGGAGGTRDKDSEGKGRDKSKGEGEAEKVGLPGSNCMARSGLSAAASGAGGSADGACKGKEGLGERAKARDLGGGKGAEWPEQVPSSWQSA